MLDNSLYLTLVHIFSVIQSGDNLPRSFHCNNKQSAAKLKIKTYLKNSFPTK